MVLRHDILTNELLFLTLQRTKLSVLYHLFSSLERITDSLLILKVKCMISKPDKDNKQMRILYSYLSYINVKIPNTKNSIKFTILKIFDGIKYNPH